MRILKICCVVVLLLHVVLTFQLAKKRQEYQDVIGGGVGQSYLVEEILKFKD